MAKYNNILPLLTSNSDKGFTVTTTAVGSSTGNYYRGFDGLHDGTTYFRSGISPNLPEYFSITFPKKYTISRYTLDIGYALLTFANMSTWDLEGLVNGTWVVLHSGSHAQVAETLTFDFTPTEVEGIRIKCKSRVGTNSWGFDNIAVYEIQYVNKFLISLNNNEVESVVPKVTLDKIPVMTSNTVPSGIVSASAEIADAWRAFDNNTGIRWQVVKKFPSWLAYEFPTQTLINKYSMSCQSSVFADRMPKDWTFEGSNDDFITKTILDNRVGVTWTSSIIQEFEFSNKTYYKKYRIHITQHNGQNNYIAIDEMKMYTVIPEYLKIINSKSEQDFLNHGMDKPMELDMTTEISKRTFIEQSPTTLGNGKVFKKTIDTTQVPIKKVTIE